MDKRRQNTRFYNCRRLEKASELGRTAPEMRHCHMCLLWSVEEDWDNYYAGYLDNISTKRYGSITIGHLLRPGFYVFCLGDASLNSSQRLVSFTRDAKLRGHIQAHLTWSSWPYVCPHPLCKERLWNPPSFACDMEDKHKVSLRQLTECPNSHSSPRLQTPPHVEVNEKREVSQEPGRSPARPAGCRKLPPPTATRQLGLGASRLADAALYLPSINQSEHASIAFPVACSQTSSEDRT